VQLKRAEKGYVEGLSLRLEGDRSDKRGTMEGEEAVAARVQQAERRRKPVAEDDDSKLLA
jgi:hypothetical protein